MYGNYNNLVVLVCTCMSSVCHSYVTHLYSYVIRMSLVYTGMSLICTRMSPVCHSYVVLPWTMCEINVHSFSFFFSRKVSPLGNTNIELWNSMCFPTLITVMKYFPTVKIITNCFSTTMTVVKCSATLITVANCFPTVITLDSLIFWEKQL